MHSVRGTHTYTHTHIYIYIYIVMGIIKSPYILHYKYTLPTTLIYIITYPSIYISSITTIGSTHSKNRFYFRKILSKCFSLLCNIYIYIYTHALTCICTNTHTYIFIVYITGTLML